MDHHHHPVWRNWASFSRDFPSGDESLNVGNSIHNLDCFFFFLYSIGTPFFCCCFFSLNMMKMITMLIAAIITSVTQSCYNVSRRLGAIIVRQSMAPNSVKLDSISICCFNSNNTNPDFEGERPRSHHQLRDGGVICWQRHALNVTSRHTVLHRDLVLVCVDRIHLS